MENLNRDNIRLARAKISRVSKNKTNHGKKIKKFTRPLEDRTTSRRYNSARGTLQPIHEPNENYINIRYPMLARSRERVRYWSDVASSIREQSTREDFNVEAVERGSTCHRHRKSEPGISTYTSEAHMPGR